jgi:hypothetical protein
MNDSFPAGQEQPGHPGDQQFQHAAELAAELAAIASAGARADVAPHEKNSTVAGKQAESGGVEDVQKALPIEAASSAELPEWLGRRIEQAIERSDFVDSPALREGITSFYAAHYELASLMETSLDEPDITNVTEDRSALQSLVDSSQFSEQTRNKLFDDVVQRGFLPNHPYVQEITPLLAQIRLAREDNPADTAFQRAELMVLAKASSCLFAEASVGVTTISLPEAEIVTDIRKRIDRKLEDSGLFRHQAGSHSWTANDLGDPQDPQTLRAVHMAEDPLFYINQKIDTFRSDCRSAGQLLFHNTGNLQDVVSNGTITSRRMQLEQYGKTNTQTVDSLDGHVHSPTPHWSEQYDSQNYRTGTDAGTIAVPLWKIIQAAPYARDAQYGVVTLKPDSQYMAEIIPVNDTTGSIGYGREDLQGRTGMDRTFYSSPNDVPAEAPVGDAPDGYELPLDGDTYLVRLASDKPLSVATTAKPYTVQTRPYEGERDRSRLVAWNKRQQEIIRDAIKSLQAESIAKTRGNYVVPLRAGVMDFYVPDDGPPDGKPRASFTHSRSA